VTEAAIATQWVPPTWDEVVREHADRVYRLAYRLSGNRADAEDLTQETFVRVFKSLAEYTPGTFEGWLHRITTNLFLDMVRRRQRIRFDALPDDAGDRLASNSAGPEQAYAEMHLDPEIQQALDALPADFRAAVVLCDLEELSYEEIAATLGIKVGTVRSRIHRGIIIVLIEIAQRKAAELRAKFLTSELPCTRALQSLEEEVLDLPCRRIGRKEYLNHTAFARHIHAVNDPDFRLSLENAVDGVGRLIRLINGIQVTAEARTQPFEQPGAVLQLRKLVQLLFERRHPGIEIFQILRRIAERAADGAKHLLRQRQNRQA
jgi:RNA polymerase sigma-70 factor (ECF subfamily)